MSSGCLIVYRWDVCPHPAFPTVAVYHWHILISPGRRLAEDQSGQRGVGRAWLCFHSCVSVTSFVSAQLTRNHVWASKTFASNSKTPHGLYLPRHWQGHGSNTAAITLSQKYIESQMPTHKHAHHPTATCLARPGADKGTVATGHPAWCLCGWGANGDSLLSLVRSLEFNLHHWRSPKNKINQRSLTPFADSPFQGWLMGLEITAALHKLHRSCCKSVTTYSLKTKSLYSLTILVKMKERILAKYSLFSSMQTDGRSS